MKIELKKVKADLKALGFTVKTESNSLGKFLVILKDKEFYGISSFIIGAEKIKNQETIVNYFSQYEKGSKIYDNADNKVITGYLNPR